MAKSDGHRGWALARYELEARRLLSHHFAGIREAGFFKRVSEFNLKQLLAVRGRPAAAKFAAHTADLFSAFPMFAEAPSEWLTWLDELVETYTIRSALSLEVRQSLSLFLDMSVFDQAEKDEITADCQLLS